MIGRLANVAFDAPDIDRLAGFYADLTGWRITERDEVWISMATGEGNQIAFQLAPDHIAPRWPGQDRPQQLHLDLLIDDVAAATERAVALGATHLAKGETWETLADPAGHPFDLCQRDGVGPTMGLYGVTFDTGDAPALARFYADLLSMKLTYEGEYGVLIADDAWQVMFQQVEHYNAPRWPDPDHPQQGHIDVNVTDLDTAEKLALTRGARRLDGGGERFRVFADPHGHPFCLCLPEESLPEDS